MRFTGGARGSDGLWVKPVGRYHSGGRWFEKIGSDKLRGFGVIHMNRAFYFAILINHLILVGYAADMIGSFPLGCQLGGALGRGGEGED